MRLIHDNIVIMGMKHSGKTTHGKLIAEKAGESFIDTDHLIEEIYFSETGRHLTCREIYLEEGDVVFRKMEHDSLHAIEKRLKSGEKAVISLGGGLVANPELEEIMSRIGIVVYLQVPYDILFSRIMANGTPPFLDTADPYETFLQICKEREPYYFKYEHLTVDLGNLPIPEANNLIETRIKEYFKQKS